MSFNQDEQQQSFSILRNGKVHHSRITHYKNHQMPAKEYIAKLHREAQRVGVPIRLMSEQQQQICPCCQRSIHKKNIKVSDDEMIFSFLGSGYPLYFNFIKCCLMIVGVLFLTSGQYSLVSNLISHDCEDLVIQAQNQYSKLKHHQEDNWKQPVYNYCLNDMVAQSSDANKRFEYVLSDLPKFFNFSSVLFILIIIFFFRKSQLGIDNECDIRENTPSDYSIIIKDLPQMEKPKQELKDFFQSNWNVEVMDINIVYYADKLVELQKKKLILIGQKKKSLQEEYTIEKANKFDEDILQIENQLKEESFKIQEDSSNFTGTAFVSFKYEDQKQEVLKNSNYQTAQIVFNMVFGCIFQQAKTIQFKDSFIKIEQAPEPGDIIWENMVYTDNRRFIFRLMGFIFSQLVIAIFLIILLELAKVQAIESSNVPDNLVDVNTPDGVIPVRLPAQSDSINIPSLLAALMTTFINTFVVDQLSSFLVKFESYETYSLYTVSLASKLSLMLFVNSAIIAFLASTFYTRNIYGPGGLIYTETYFFISNAIIPPIVNLISPDRIVKALQIWIIKKFKRIVSQDELNELYEYPIHQIELRYADIMKTLYITFFYAPLIPAGYITSFLGLALYYYAEKISLVYYSTVKITPSAQLSILMTEMMEYLPIIFALGSLIFTYQITNEISYWAILSVLLALTSSILPMQYFIERLFPVEEQDETTTFQEAKLNFQTYYDKQNPVTKYNPNEEEEEPKTPRKSIQ